MLQLHDIWGTDIDNIWMVGDNGAILRRQRTFALNVTPSVSGTGHIISVPEGTDCGTHCQEVYAAGTVVTLTASADAGMLFGGWSGACSGMGPCTIAMDGAKAVTATFDVEGSVMLQGSMMYYGGQFYVCRTRCLYAEPTRGQKHAVAPAGTA